MSRLISLMVLTLLVGGCNGGDADAEPSFTLESATHELNPETAKEVDYPGIPGVMNGDDDNEDGQTDWKEDAFNSSDDDYTALILHSPEKNPLKVTLDGVDVRLWHAGKMVLDDSGSWSPEAAESIEFFVEFGGTLATASLKVQNLETDESVNTHLTASPIILAGHSQSTEKVWVMDFNYYGTNNASMVDSMESVLGDRLRTLDDGRYGYDVWVQDEFELSSMVGGEERMDLVIDSIRDGQGYGGLDDVPEDEIEGKNTIVRTWGTGYANTYDSFGNLEITPPMTVDGVNYPYGRVYYGKKGNQGPVDALTSKLDNQKLQAPFYVDTTWLCVGHVDEFSTFVPDPTAPRGFRFLYADTRAGWEVLDATDPSFSLPRYASSSPWKGHNIKNAGEMVNKSGLRDYNEDIQSQYLDPILDVFKEELGLTDEEIVPFPSVFHEEFYNGGSCGAVAIVPGAVNMLLVNETDGTSHAFMPDPFFRSNVDTQSGDPFIEAYEAVMPDNIQTHYVDDFEVYHLGLGEVHCGTNSLRTPIDGWWDTAGHLLKEGGQ